jgi:hypothetical protein
LAVPQGRYRSDRAWLLASSHAEERRNKAQTGSSERLRELLEQRYEILKAVVEQQNRLLSLGRISIGEVRAATVAMLHAEADLCATDTERIKIHEKLVTTLREQEDLLARDSAAGRKALHEVVKAKLARLEAQIDLEKLKLAQQVSQ